MDENTFLDILHDGLRDIEADARALEYLGRAFSRTGNDSVAQELESIAQTLKATAQGIRGAHSHLLNERVNASHRETAAILKAGLVAMTSGRVKP